MKWIKITSVFVAVNLVGVVTLSSSARAVDCNYELVPTEEVHAPKKNGDYELVPTEEVQTPEKNESTNEHQLFGEFDEYEEKKSNTTQSDAANEIVPEHKQDTPENVQKQEVEIEVNSLDSNQRKEIINQIIEDFDAITEYLIQNGDAGDEEAAIEQTPLVKFRGKLEAIIDVSELKNIQKNLSIVKAELSSKKFVVPPVVSSITKKFVRMGCLASTIITPAALTSILVMSLIPEQICPQGSRDIGSFYCQSPSNASSAAVYNGSGHSPKFDCPHSDDTLIAGGSIQFCLDSNTNIVTPAVSETLASANPSIIGTSDFILGSVALAPALISIGCTLLGYGTYKGGTFLYYKWKDHKYNKSLGQLQNIFPDLAFNKQS